MRKNGTKMKKEREGGKLEIKGEKDRKELRAFFFFFFFFFFFAFHFQETTDTLLFWVYQNGIFYREKAKITPGKNREK